MVTPISRTQLCKVDIIGMWNALSLGFPHLLSAVGFAHAFNYLNPNEEARTGYFHNSHVRWKYIG